MTSKPQLQFDSNEPELIRRVCNGETEAFEELVRPYKRFVYMTAISVLRNDVTGVFCTSGSEREITLEGSWYADEEIQAGADRDVAAAGWVELANGKSTPQACKEAEWSRRN
jgi:hypothetical protein